MSAIGSVSRVSPVHTAMRNCTRDEGGPFELGNQVLISNHCKLLSLKAMVVSVAANVGTNPSGRGWERRAQANRRWSVEIGLDDGTRSQSHLRTFTRDKVAPNSEW